MPRARKPQRPAATPRFVAVDILGKYHVYEGNPLSPNDEIAKQAKHFITVATMAGAERLAMLLNDAAALGEIAHIIAPDPEFGREKIAFAVARLFGFRVEKRED